MTVEMKLLEFAHDIFEDSDITKESQLKNAKSFDSMAVAQYLTVIEQEFNIDLSDLDGSKLLTVNDYIGEVQKRKP